MKKVARSVMVDGKVKKVEGWLPEAIADDIGKLFVKQENTLDTLAKITGFDYVTGLFKSYVTSLFPGFHARNITSNNFQNMIKLGVDAVNPKLHKYANQILTGKKLDTVVTMKNGTTKTLGQLKEIIEKNSDILDKGQFSRVESFLKECGLKMTEYIQFGEKLDIEPFYCIVEAEKL